LPPGGVPIIPEADSLLLVAGGLAALVLVGAVRRIRRRSD
jgi:MYXO-CTERM domain-containing protein